MKIEQLFSVRGKVALVTGGSRGIGEMIARGYVENGAKVYITARKADACDALARELSRIGECISIPADLSAMDEIERLAGEMQRREKRLDILVNNAGATWGASFEDFPESGWDKIMDLNVKSVFFLTQRLLKLLEAAGRADDFARVINVGSIDGIHVSGIETYSYAASKAGVLHVTRMMAKYLAQEAHRRERHRAGIFSLENDRGHSRGDRPSRRAADPDVAGRPSGGYGRGGALSFVEGQRVRVRGHDRGRRRLRDHGVSAGSCFRP